MTKHVARVSERSLSALKVLLGRQVHSVYAPVLAISGTHVAAPSFAIPLSDESNGSWQHHFLNVRAVWKETPRFLNDYWELQASDDDAPLGIEVNAERALMAPCTISFYETGHSPISSIRVHSFSAPDSDDETESVAFDKAIEIIRLNARSLCFACQLNGPGIAEDVRLSEDPSVIQQLLDGCVVRLTLE